MYGVGATAYTIIARCRLEQTRLVCASHLKVLTQAMLLYVADNGERFPPASAWSDRLLPYAAEARMLLLYPPDTADDSMFVCPVAKNQECSYAFSASLGGVNASELADPRHTTMLFESDRGWNAAGGAELLPEVPRHDPGERYAFADGSSHFVARRMIGKDRWGRRIYAREPVITLGWVPIWQPVLKEPAQGEDARRQTPGAAREVGGP